MLVFALVAVSGFGLYEMSTASHALGWAVDVSVTCINPATLSDLTNITDSDLV